MESSLFHTHLVDVVPRGHVGDDHAVTGRETLQHFYSRHRALAQLYCLPNRRVPIRPDLEQGDGAVGLTERRATDIEHVVQSLDLDRAIDAEIRSRARGERTLE